MGAEEDALPWAFWTKNLTCPLFLAPERRRREITLAWGPLRSTPGSYECFAPSAPLLSAIRGERRRREIILAWGGAKRNPRGGK